MEQPKLQKTIWLYYAIGFLNSLSFFGAVLVPFFTNWGHISLFQVQLLQSWYMAWAFLLDVPTGVLADQIGRKYILSLGCFFLAVGSLLYGTLPYFSIF